MPLTAYGAGGTGRASGPPARGGRRSPGAREAEDARIVGYVDGLDEAALAGTIAYRRVSTPEPQVQLLALALAAPAQAAVGASRRTHRAIARLVDGYASSSWPASACRSRVRR